MSYCKNWGVKRVKPWNLSLKKDAYRWLIKVRDVVIDIQDADAALTFRRHAVCPTVTV